MQYIILSINPSLYFHKKYSAGVPTIYKIWDKWPSTEYLIKLLGWCNVIGGGDGDLIYLIKLLWWSNVVGCRDRDVRHLITDNAPDILSMLQVAGTVTSYLIYLIQFQIMAKQSLSEKNGILFFNLTNIRYKIIKIKNPEIEYF
jgi:hypothetical protein